MAHRDNSELGVSYDLPDVITLGQDLAFTSSMVGIEGNLEKGFLNCFALISNWQCAAIPDPEKLAALPTNKQRKTIVNWVISDVIEYCTNQTDVPKG